MAPGAHFEVAGYTFFANFDSGNLGHVSLVAGGEAAASSPRPSTSGGGGGPPTTRPSTSSSSSTVLPRTTAGADAPDVEFNVWTRPDCHGTEFENGNRTWFYFGMRGGVPGAVVKFNVMNMNKQSKLFSQGMSPIFLLTPGKHQWERLRDKPTFYNEENNFILSFRFRNLEDTSSAVYFAFTYPYTYKELQNYLAKLDKKHQNGSKTFEELSALPTTCIYYHRENVVRSLEHRRLDLLTITDLGGLSRDKEAVLEHLFAEEAGNRPHKFEGKKVVFLSARVHPGETCSSFVINGFIKFLLRETDPRAAVLRKKYVFKLLPMLNPDGVANGHYRTDTRGVNLNRVYAQPSRTLHPTIYAARKLLLYAHLGTEVKEDCGGGPPPPSEAAAAANSASDAEMTSPKQEAASRSDQEDISVSSLTEPEWYKPTSFWDLRGGRARTSTSSRVSNSSRTSNSSSHLLGISPVKQDNWYEMTDTSRFSEGDESIADFSVPSYGIGALLGVSAGRSLVASFDESSAYDLSRPAGGSETCSSGSSRRGSTAYERRTSFKGAFCHTEPPPPDPLFGGRPATAGSGGKGASLTGTDFSVMGAEESLVKEVEEAAGADDKVPTYPPPDGRPSGLFLFVDIHGHASKRGIFMYGNHFRNTNTTVDSLLFPKLMSYNSANFDFPACNFTERNMYLKDRHTGLGREGSGRVGVYKATGIVYSYTLECNFNTGRIVNPMPMASRDAGRATPPLHYDNPPKYTPAVYEETGKAMAVSILDLTESNPWTRLTCSACKNLKGVRAWIQQYLKSAETESATRKSVVNKAGGSKTNSPVRTRFRNINSEGKKSSSAKLPRKLSLKATGLGGEGACRSAAAARKNLSPKNSQSLGGKPAVLQRSNSRGGKAGQGGAAAAARSTAGSLAARPVKAIKKKRLRSAAKKAAAGSRPTSKTGSRVGSKPVSKSASRSSSPRRVKAEGKKSVLHKKTTKGQAWQNIDENEQPVSPAAALRLKKRKSAMNKLV